MNEKQIKTISKTLSYLLRHKPEAAGLTLDAQGWVDTEQLLSCLEIQGLTVSMELLEEVVATNDKQRFAFNENKTKIRASQGHSVAVALDLAASIPPEYLFHGTVERFVEAIKQQGLQKMSRQQVHLTGEKETAATVGSRRGKAVVLTVRSGQMHRDGMVFYLSENGVWLTEAVPPMYINFYSNQG